MNKPVANVVVFACNWDGLSCIEAAAQKGLRYPASVKIVRVSCLSRVHSGLILKAFELGADGVMLLGCNPGNCHFEIDAGLVEREYEKTRNILGLLGLREERLALIRLPGGDGPGFVKQVTNFIAGITQTQPATSR
jgi:F420-non-reducing hydrogenase iron-sulfur subunit